MTSRNTIGTDHPKKFDAYVQFNAAKGGYDFNYDGLNWNRYQQINKEKRLSPTEPTRAHIPQNLLGVDLNEKQQNALRESKTTYVQGMLKTGRRAF